MTSQIAEDQSSSNVFGDFFFIFLIFSQNITYKFLYTDATQVWEKKINIAARNWENPWWLAYHELQRIGGRGRRVYDFFCCYHFELVAHAPELLHTLQTCCTHPRVAAHSPSLTKILKLIHFFTAQALKLLHVIGGC